RAVSILKAAYPEFKEYPNEDLPLQSIRAEKTSEGWRVAFVQEGLGRPILGAKCFLVKNNGAIADPLTYAPLPGSDVFTNDFSATTCSPSTPYNPFEPKCELETCHGLEITCGPNPPDACTAMYGVGDRCLQYARCAVQDRTCRQVEDARFNRCKECAENCVTRYAGDPSDLFACEGNC
ncbi:TPA: hypothetical protein HA318_00440, partial [Candidatus Micrarchaeota archaeon]|nr:hypothetical protein [Candidatus Micrarchaeota archaeon]